ncbi:unnamed protein product [Adineta ricciae]|uniref:Uncharacterized protein n=1 Tax=Adineta ricciae TaxID=249248 RepID=A0A813SFL8_ADIRI|nr:unnamed protein product [Adineta ricciae]
MSKYVSTYSCRINDDQDESMNKKYRRFQMNKLIDETLEMNRRLNKYEIFQRKTLNLVFMGKSGIGKKTISNVLENPFYISSPSKLYYENTQIDLHPISIQNCHFNQPNWICCLNILSTCEIMKKTKKIIDKCVQEDLTHIHFFAFVCNFQKNLDEQEINSLKFIVKNYSFLQKYFYLIFTHCEETNSIERNDKLKEFFQCEHLQQYHFEEFFNEKIFFLGSLRSQLLSSPDKTLFQEQFNKICLMRNIFLDFLSNLNPNDYFHIEQISSWNNCHIF